ncbi:MAG: hypothetical protein IKZ82_04425 [Clostridia bacterium]|nr:hypothetical protein [Clostridia bacterium]
MKKLSPTTRLTVGAMTTALGVLFTYAASIVPSGKLVLLFLASVVIWIPLNERGGIVSAIICYLATALLSFLLIPNKLYPLAYALFFGLYGFIKLGVDGAVHDRFIAFALKLILMNALAAAVIWLGSLIIKQDVFSLLPDYPLYAVMIAMEVALILFELAYTFCIGIIDSRLRSILISRK